jgi:hypothetical protein
VCNQSPLLWFYVSNRRHILDNIPVLIVILCYCPDSEAPTNLARPISLPLAFKGWRLDTLALVMPFFMDTVRLCSRLGSGDAVLKLLRKQDSVSSTLLSQAASRSKGFGPQFGFTLRFGTVASTVASTVSYLHWWGVCRFLTGAQARHALPPATPTVSLSQVLHYTLFVLSVSHRQSVAFETWKPTVIH